MNACSLVVAVTLFQWCRANHRANKWCCDREGWLNNGTKKIHIQLSESSHTVRLHCAVELKMFDTDKFIECVHANPALLDKTLQQYSDIGMNAESVGWAKEKKRSVIGLRLIQRTWNAQFIDIRKIKKILKVFPYGSSILRMNWVNSITLFFGSRNKSLRTQTNLTRQYFNTCVPEARVDVRE